MNNKIKNIGLFYGGRSSEHSISCISANFVYKKLKSSKYKIIPIYINKDGDVFLPNILGDLIDSKENLNDKVTFILKDKQFYVQTKKGNCSIDFIFPILHGLYGEDGTIQGFSEFYNIPYAGCGVLSSAICMDKKYMKDIFSQKGFLQTSFFEILFSDWIKNSTEVCLEITKKFKFPIFVKPCNTGSSIGISKVYSLDSLISAIDFAFKTDPYHVIIEESVENLIELEVAIVGSPGNYKISEVGSCEVPSSIFYSFEEKYNINSVAKLEVPAKISKELKNKIQKKAIEVFSSVLGNGFARIDFFFSKSTELLYINEINTIPGFTSISMFPILWEATNCSIESILSEIITLGISRKSIIK